MRVPALLWWPEQISAGTYPEFISASDILPTLLEAVGGPQSIPEGIHGASQWRSLVKGEQTPKPDYLVTGFDNTALYQPPWKLITGDRLELYDVFADPTESNDMAALYPERVVQMQKIIEQWPAGEERGVEIRKFYLTWIPLGDLKIVSLGLKPPLKMLKKKRYLMTINPRQQWVRLLLTLASGSLAVVVPLVDLNASHLLHPDWSMHARFHVLWAVLVFSMIGWYSLYLLWLSPWMIMTRIHIVMVITLIVNSAFLATTALRSFYGGALADEHGGVPNLPNGWDPNLTVVIATLLLLALLGGCRRRRKMVQLFKEDIKTSEVLAWKGVHLFHFSGSSCSQKTRIVLNLKGIEWVSHPINLLKAENYSQWYLGINPRGLLPALVHNGDVHRE